MNIRPARPEDDAALLALDFATWTTLMSPAPAPTPEERTAFFSEKRPVETYLVAEVDGVVSGYVELHQDIPLESHAHVRQIGGLAVAAEARGKGVGSKLLEAVLDMARQQGAAKVTLRVLGHNTVARRLYERFGFAVEGVLKGEFVLDGQVVDDVLMAYYL